MVICACGTSYYAGMFSSFFFKSLGVFNTITSIEGSEFSEYDIPQQNAGMICVS